VVSSFPQGEMKLLFVWFGGLVRQGRYEIDSGFINSTGELNYHSDGFVTFSCTIVQSKKTGSCLSHVCVHRRWDWGKLTFFEVRKPQIR
jgi:hypothetical protein